MLITASKSKGLEVLGLGTALLLAWRFLDLPTEATTILWNCAIGAMACGSALAISEREEFTKERRLAVILVGLTCVGMHFLLNPPMAVYEEVALGVGLVWLAVGLLRGLPNWAFALATLGVVAMECGHIYSGFPTFDPYRWILTGLLATVCVRWHTLITAILGLIIAVAGCLLAIFPIGFLDPSELAGLLLLAGCGISLMQLVRAVPDLPWLGSIGMHAGSLYALGAVVAKLLGDSYVTFGWSMYAPEGEPMPYVSFSAAFPLGFTLPSVWMLLAALAITGFAAYRRTWGPLEMLWRAWFRAL